MGKIGPLAPFEISDFIIQYSMYIKVWWQKYRPAPKINGIVQQLPGVLAAFPAPKPNEKPKPEDGPYFLTQEKADRVLIEVLCNYNIDNFLNSVNSVMKTIPCFGTHYDYLANAYANLCDTNSIFSTLKELNRLPFTKEQEAIALHTINLLKSLIINYLTLFVQEPDAFGFPASINPNNARNAIPLRALHYAYPQIFFGGPIFPSDAGKEMLHKMLEMSASNNSGSLSKVVEGSLKAIMNLALNVSTFEMIPVVDSMFNDLISQKGVPEEIVKLPMWMGVNSSSGDILETTSIFGVLFGLSLSSKKSPLSLVILKEFGNIDELNFKDMKNIKKSLYSRIEGHHSYLLSFVKAFLKASPSTENAMFDWIAAVLNANADRAKYNHNIDALSSSGMLLNLLAVLLMISQSLSSKIDSIQRSYLSCSKRLDLHSETRIATSLTEYLSMMSNSANAGRIRTLAGSDAELNIKNDVNTEEVPNRPSECFFLTMRCFHIAFTCTINELTNIYSILRRNPQHPAAPNFKKIAVMMETYIENEHLLGLAGIFWSIFTRWALTTVCPPKTKGVEYSVCVPLPKEVPLSFALIPESTICDVAVYVKHTARINKLLIPVSKINDIMNFLICFIASRSYVKEFAVRKTLLDALTNLIPRPNESSLIIEDVFCSHQPSKIYLIPALIRFSTDAEFTGSSSQYYDRINYRLDAQQLYNHLLQFPDYKRSFASYVASPDDSEVVAKFSIYLVNDVNFMFEDTLENVQLVQSLEKEMAKNAHSAADPTMKENIEDARKRVQSSMYMLTKNINFFLLINRISTVAYTSSDSALRSVSNMTIFSLQKLSLGSSSLLSMGDNEYDFNPSKLRDLISEAVSKFANNDKFASFCAENPGFTDELIETTASLIECRGTFQSNIAKALRMLKVKVAEIRAADDDSMDIDLDDVPEDLVDPISGDIMYDPVYLPSKNAVDRSTFNDLLLTDPVDPFTRIPLTEKSVIPATDLKERVDAFIKEYKATHK